MTITYRFVLCVLLSTHLGTLSLTEANLASTDPDISDGPCQFPTKLALNTNILEFGNPAYNYYIPLAHKALYRAEHEVLKNRPADTEEDILAMRPRIRMLRGRTLLRLGTLGLTFYEGTEANFDYACLPSFPLFLSSKNWLSPFLNMTCVIGSGSRGMASPSSFGIVYFSLIWSDGIATNAWGCIKGVPSFHIMSKTPTLTDEQISANMEILDSLGFNRSHYQHMFYDDNRHNIQSNLIDDTESPMTLK